ncbi:MAG: AraC family transcriptional regulator [Bacillota bacterium]
MSDSIELGKPKWGGDAFKSKPDNCEEHLEEMIQLYRDELMSFEEIGQKLNIDWWNIKGLFKKHGIARYSVKERAFLKRQKDYPIIYKLHYELNLSLNEIYRNYGYSPPYSRAVLSDGLKEDN